MKPLEEMSIL